MKYLAAVLLSLSVATSVYAATPMATKNDKAEAKKAAPAKAAAKDAAPAAAPKLTTEQGEVGFFHTVCLKQGTPEAIAKFFKELAGKGAPVKDVTAERLAKLKPDPKQKPPVGIWAWEGERKKSIAIYEGGSRCDIFTSSQGLKPEAVKTEMKMLASGVAKALKSSAEYVKQPLPKDAKVEADSYKIKVPDKKFAVLVGVVIPKGDGGMVQFSSRKIAP